MHLSVFLITDGQYFIKLRMQERFSLYMKINMRRDLHCLAEYGMKECRLHRFRCPVILLAERAVKVTDVCDFNVDALDHRMIIVILPIV